MPAAYYLRPDLDDEQRQSLQPFALEEYCPSVAAARLNFASGTTFHQDALSAVGEVDYVLIELVPEPGNPHDNRAVALDVDGMRCGYIHADSAPWYHDTVRAMNGAGYAVLTTGQISLTEWESREMFALQWRRPDLDDLHDLATAAGLREAHERVVLQLGRSDRVAMANDCWTDYAQPVVRALRQHAALAPELTWATGGSLPKAQRLPIWHYAFVRDDVQEHRRLRRTTGRVARALRRRVRALEATERLRVRDNERAAREQQRREILALKAKGWTHERTALAVGARHSTVERVVREARSRVSDDGVPLFDHSERLRSERVERAVQADGLRNEGFSRVDIAARLGVGRDAVKQLLSDGRFYRDPAGNADRRIRALSAGALLDQGATRDVIATSLGLSTPATITAIRDARALGHLQEAEDHA